MTKEPKDSLPHSSSSNHGEMAMMDKSCNEEDDDADEDDLDESM